MRPALAAAAGNPFAFGASVGPSAASRVDAFVTRTVDGHRVTLPASAVPALEPGDDVVVRFPDYTRPPAKVNYHVNVAFITETPPVGWLYPKSGPWDRLFTVPARRRQAHSKPAPAPELRFTYGKGDYRGIPIFFIVPEDDKTRGMDGLRDYVEAHPTDFKDMSVSSNEAVERYSWFRDFLSALAQGAIDPLSSQQRVVAIATSLGADPDSVNACYVSGEPPGTIANCVQTALLSVQYNTNIEAPTQAQFFGGAASAALPVQMALYLEPLLAIWQIFSRDGHKEYEYLPSTLHLVSPVMPESNDKQLLMGLKVPTLRPPAAYSSVLFFTIGDPEAVANPPSVVDDDNGTGVCARDPRVKIPLHLNATSPYVNDTQLDFTSESAASSLSVPIDPRNAAAPLVDRSRLRAGQGYDVRLTGRFGFDPLRGSARDVAHVAVPGSAHWNVAEIAYRPARTGSQLDAIATSEAAPCLSSAELQMAGNAPVPLKITHLDDQRVELTGSLKSVPPGVAQVRFFQSDPAEERTIADSTTLVVAREAATVATKPAPAAYAGDREVLIDGSGLGGVRALEIDSKLYAKTPQSQGDEACFTGAPIGGNGEQPGGSVTAQLVPDDKDPGEAFTLQIRGQRPGLAQVRVTPAQSDYTADEALTIALSSGSVPLPRRFEVRMRQAPVVTTPCDALQDDPTAVVVPAKDLRRDSISQLTASLAPADVLHDDAIGTLQVQIVDDVTKLESDWVDLPGQFTFAPPPTPSPRGT